MISTPKNKFPAGKQRGSAGAYIKVREDDDDAA